MYKLNFADTGVIQSLFGESCENLKQLEESAGVVINTRGTTVMVEGDPVKVEIALDVLRELYDLVAAGYPLFVADVDYAWRIKSADAGAGLKEIFLDKVYIRGKDGRRRFISPKSRGQKYYIDAIRRHDIVFAVGPAGTGKTYLAMAMAIAALREHQVERIILTRPAVEAGERLGFLPGDLLEKIDPYLRPLYDALHDIVSFDKTREMLDKGIIEVAPLAFMRGRTLNDAFVILDEAQNSTNEQMKMFLTRLGFGSKAVVTGDVTQTDLPGERQSGLVTVQKILKGVKGIGFCHLTEVDVVRHPLVQKIIAAYDRYDREKN
ncbi:MAG: PhoH family protein [Deltaproteobacteria bacterium]|nr:PhoH family protein [Deltaproteobacteria bacterium]